MSNRLMKRGRYPKVSSSDQVASSNSYLYSTPTQPMPEVSFYNSPAQTQVNQQVWSPQNYSDSNGFQPNLSTQPAPEIPIYQSGNQVNPAPETSGYGLGNQVHLTQEHAWSNSWNNTPEYLGSTSYQQLGASNIIAEQYQQQDLYANNQNYHVQNVPGYEQPSQHLFQPSLDYQMNLNVNDPSIAWNSNNTLIVSQQHSSTTPLPFCEEPASQTETQQWPYGSAYNAVPSISQSNEQTMWLNSNHVISDCMKEHTTPLFPNINEEQVVLDSQPSEQKETLELAVRTSELEVVNEFNCNTEQNDENYTTSSTLSAFFHDSDNSSTVPENPIHSADKVNPEISSQEASPLETLNIVPNSDSEEEKLLTHTDFIHLEEDSDKKDKVSAHLLKSSGDASVLFSDDPDNQEIPELSLVSSSDIPLTKDTSEITVDSEEPPNQQIPSKYDSPTHSSSPEHERLVIRPREESPFKPPTSNSTKSTIVQQESVLSSKNAELKSHENKSVVQEVNLETFPDNLEQPLDYGELQKQSPLRKQREVANKKRLRNEVNSSPISLLCDNPNVPNVTFAAAAPPISSAKSDKSESSTDSKLESLSMASSSISLSRLNESNLTSSSCDAPETELSEKYKNISFQSKKSGNLADRSFKSHKPDTSSNSTSDEAHHFQTDYRRAGYLKDTKINSAERDSYRRPEYQEHASHYRESSDRHSRSREHRYDPEMNRHQFSEQKYPTFDERQYYSDKERSRPSSRSSLRDHAEDYSYQRRPNDFSYSSDRRNPEYCRPSSRSSESELSRRDRHEQYGYYKESYQYPPNPQYRGSEYYQRPDNRGYDYHSYQRDPYYTSYYDAYRYACNNYNYGFYDEMYRNDPRYQQFREAQEQYRQYYEKCQYDEYERSSIHSDHSSVNELSKDIVPSSQYSEPGLDSNESELSAYNTEQYRNESYNEISNFDIDQSSTPSSRLTPFMFSYAHPIIRFSPGGQLISVIPNQLNASSAALVRIHSVQDIREGEESFEELKSYQGPLVRGSTHKNDVIEFCSQKIKTLNSKADVVDRSSSILLWELMVLLLRQNGSVVGSDISELLLKDHDILQSSMTSLKQVETPLAEQSPSDVIDSSCQSHVSSPDEGIVVSSDKTMLNTSRTIDVDQITKKFREFLMFGHKKDALEWAMKHRLWGHALFLASKMDARTYANVMTRFANSLALNDPLQTLYQLMSGRQPLAVTNVADRKWGDWRPHLAMILSNPSTHPDVDSRSITTLGDTLASKGCLSAAHFCYIMAQVDFGTYEQKDSKLVLLASNHLQSFGEFATNEAIQITEIYEYAQSLANPDYILVHLQFYKFLYAMRLVEHGFLAEALHYTEIISNKLLTHSNLFQSDFVSDVFKLATHLKYHDPHFLRGQGEYEDQEDPDWLKNLSQLVQNYENIVAGNTQHYNEYTENQNLKSNLSQHSQYSPSQLENFSASNLSSSALPADTSGSSYQTSYYQPDMYNQQNSFQNSTYINGNIEPTPFYPSDISSRHSSFQRDNSIPSHEENETTDVPSSPVTQSPPFDYYNQNKQDYDSKTTHEHSGSFSQTLPRERRDSALSSGSRYSSGSTSATFKNHSKEISKPMAKKEKPNTQAGKTWLGGIFSRFLQAPNQMILPDDKNPTIVWDENKSCWVDKDGNDDENTAPLAPPTDSELKTSSKSFTTQFSAMHLSSAPSPSASLGANNTVPPSGSIPTGPVSQPTINKFQRPKHRALRQNYIDVLQSSGATAKTNAVPENLFPSLEPLSAPQMFIPNSNPSIGENPVEYESNQMSFNMTATTQEAQTEVQASPVMYDPTQIEARRPSVQRNTLGHSGRRQYPT